MVLSVYNEAKGIQHFWLSLKKQLDTLTKFDFEVIWVNDGSKDESQQLINSFLSENTSPNIKQIKIEFSRNFGHEAAMIAGIDNATGNAIICMDTDGQHPVEKLADLIDAYQAGNKIVLTERLSRTDTSTSKAFLSKIFYIGINYLSSIPFQKNSTDFFLIAEEVAAVLKNDFRDQVRFIRGFIQSIGFQKTTITYKALDRIYGNSNYSYWSLFKLAINAIFSFSNKPLRISVGISLCFILFTLSLGGYSLYKFLYEDTAPTGYTTIVIFLSISFAILFLTLAVISLYFEKLITEVRKRPLYIIKALERS